MFKGAGKGESTLLQAGAKELCIAPYAGRVGKNACRSLQFFEDPLHRAFRSDDAGGHRKERRALLSEGNALGDGRGGQGANLPGAFERAEQTPGGLARAASGQGSLGSH